MFERKNTPNSKHFQTHIESTRQRVLGCFCFGPWIIHAETGTLTGLKATICLVFFRFLFSHRIPVPFVNSCHTASLFAVKSHCHNCHLFFPVKTTTLNVVLAVKKKKSLKLCNNSHHKQFCNLKSSKKDSYPTIIITSSPTFYHLIKIKSSYLLLYIYIYIYMIVIIFKIFFTKKYIKIIYLIIIYF
jgi:hypothetical protein